MEELDSQCGATWVEDMSVGIQGHWEETWVQVPLSKTEQFLIVGYDLPDTKTWPPQMEEIAEFTVNYVGSERRAAGNDGLVLRLHLSDDPVDTDGNPLKLGAAFPDLVPVVYGFWFDMDKNEQRAEEEIQATLVGEARAEAVEKGHTDRIGRGVLVGDKVRVGLFAPGPGGVVQQPLAEVRGVVKNAGPEFDIDFPSLAEWSRVAHLLQTKCDFSAKEVADLGQVLRNVQSQEILLIQDQTKEVDAN